MAVSISVPNPGLSLSAAHAGDVIKALLPALTGMLGASEARNEEKFAASLAQMSELQGEVQAMAANLATVFATTDKLEAQLLVGRDLVLVAGSPSPSETPSSP